MGGIITRFIKGTLRVIAVVVLCFTVVLMFAIGNEIVMLRNLVEDLNAEIGMYQYIIRQELYPKIGMMSDTVDNITDIIEILRKRQKTLQEGLTLYERAGVPNIDTMLKANVLITNRTFGCTGSGTVIKYEDKYYILTAAHVVDSYDATIDITFGELGKLSSGYPAVVKYMDTDVDLALLELYKLDIDSYIEVSAVAPKVGDKITVVGCPAGTEDIVTNGIVSKVDDTYGMMFTNKIFFGNSGGGVFYKGKLVGVACALIRLYHSGISEQYGISPEYHDVIGFLEDATEDEEETDDTDIYPEEVR